MSIVVNNKVLWPISKVKSDFYKIFYIIKKLSPRYRRQLWYLCNDFFYYSRA